MLRRLSVKLRSPSRSPTVVPHSPKSPPAFPRGDAGNARRLAALKATGLVSSSSIPRDLSAQERARDMGLPIMARAIPSKAPTSAMLIQKQWTESTCGDVQSLDLFKFGGDSLDIPPINSSLVSDVLDALDFPEGANSTEPATLTPTQEEGVEAQQTLPIIHACPAHPAPAPVRVDAAVIEDQMGIVPWSIPLPPSPALGYDERLVDVAIPGKEIVIVPRSILLPSSSSSSYEERDVLHPLVTISVLPPSCRNSIDHVSSKILAPLDVISDSESVCMPSLAGSIPTASSISIPETLDYIHASSPIIVEEPVSDVELVTTTSETPSSCPLKPTLTLSKPAQTNRFNKFLKSLKRSQTSPAIEISKKAVFRRSTVLPDVEWAAPSLSESLRSPKLQIPPVNRPSLDSSRRSNSRRRDPASPTMHNRASIVIEMATIDDDESRRMTEMAFLT